MTSLLGYQLFSGTYPELSKTIDSTLQQPGFHTLTTLNPEMIVAAQKSDSLSQFIGASKIIVADGTGLIMASKLLKTKPISKMAGIDVITHLFKDHTLTFYCVGATAEVIEKCRKQLPFQFKKAKFVGFHHGYLTDKIKETVLADIKHKRPDIVLVGMGVGQQDKFLTELQQRIDRGLGIGIGGAFDVLSGTKKRAPKWVINLGLEWVCRGLKEPHRIATRWHFLPKFIGLVVKTKFTTLRSR